MSNNKKEIFNNPLLNLHTFYCHNFFRMFEKGNNKADEASNGLVYFS